MPLVYHVVEAIEPDLRRSILPFGGAAFPLAGCVVVYELVECRLWNTGLQGRLEEEVLRAQMSAAAHALGEKACQYDGLGCQSFDAGLLELDRSRRSAHHAPANVELCIHGYTGVGIVERADIEEVLVARFPRFI